MELINVKKKLKVIVVGSYASGKTTLLYNYIFKKFTKPPSTVGLEFFTIKLKN